ncbi:MAG: hypothetical protein JXQ30_14235 [Spirochaetes bacterium]|nr:hypothetical protein [Spirochaetota bacterium]
MTVLIMLLPLYLISLPQPARSEMTGFFGITIGMSRSEVIRKAEETDIILVPKNRDVEFFPVEDRKILTLSIEPEVPFIYCQFYDDILLALTAVFDERHIDYYALAAEMERRYGGHMRITPSWREWEIDGILIKVEKPAVLKIMDIDELIKRAAFEPEVPPMKARRDMILQGL